MPASADNQCSTVATLTSSSIRVEEGNSLFQAHGLHVSEQMDYSPLALLCVRCAIAHSRKRPKVCENQNPKIQSGQSKAIHGLSVKHVEFMGLIKRYAKSIIGCYPNIGEG